MNTAEDIYVERVRKKNDSFKIVDSIRKIKDRLIFIKELLIEYNRFSTDDLYCSAPQQQRPFASLELLLVILLVLVLNGLLRPVNNPVNRANNTLASELRDPDSVWPDGNQNFNQYQHFCQIPSNVSRRIILDQTERGIAVAVLNANSPYSSHDDLSNQHDIVNQNHTPNNSSNTGLDNTERVQSCIRATTNAVVNAQERNTQSYMKYLPIGTDRNNSMTYCKLLYTENDYQNIDAPITNRTEETNTKKNDKADSMTQTNEAVNNNWTSIKQFSIQTNPIIDFRHIPRDEPDGQSRNHSTTNVKIISGSDNQSNNDNSTNLKAVNTTNPNYIQSNSENWIDSLDVLIGSYLDGSHDDISNWSQESNSLNSEVDNADQCSSGEDTHFNGTETSKPFNINDLSFDSDDMFGD